MEILFVNLDFWFFIWKLEDLVVVGLIFCVVVIGCSWVVFVYFEWGLDFGSLFFFYYRLLVGFFVYRLCSL